MADEICAKIANGDTKTRMKLLPDLRDALQSGSNQLSNAGEVLSQLSTILSDNNSNVISSTLDCIKIVLQTNLHPNSSANHAHNNDLSPYFTMLATSLSTEVFGDSKSSLRDLAVQTSQLLIPIATNVSQFYEKIVVLNLRNKSNWRVRSSGLKAFSMSLEQLPSGKTPLQSKVGRVAMGGAVELLGDANQEVRTSAIECLIMLYSVDPAGVRSYVQKKASTIRPAIMKELSDGFNELDLAGGPAEDPSPPDEGDKTQPDHEDQQQQAKAKPARRKPQPARDREHAVTGNQAPPPSSSTTSPGLPSPIVVYSERALSSHLSEISAALNNTDSDFWTERMNALLSLERLILGQAHVNYKTTFLAAMKSLPIGAQIEDLRSQITSQACRTVTTLAEHLQDSFSPFLELWLPSLLHLSISGVRLMAMQGHTCLKHLMAVPRAGYHLRVVKFLMARCQDKACHPQERRACVGALGTAYRRWGKAGLERAEDKFARVLRDMLGARDPTVREEARHCYWAYASQFQRGAEKMLGELDSSMQRALSRCREECEERWEKFIEGVESGYASATATATATTTTTQQQPTSPPRELGTARRQKATARQQQQQQQPAAATHSQGGGGARRVVRKNPQAGREEATQGKVKGGPARVTQQQQQTKGKVKGNQREREDAGFNLDEILNSSNNKHWAAREECFKAIATNIEAVGRTLTPHATTRFAAALSTHIGDPHHRVAQAALEACLLCVSERSLAQLLSPHLPLILPPVLAQLVSTKQRQREIANETLNECRRAYDPNALAAVLCSKFAEANDRVKPGILELLSVIVPEAEEYLGVVTNMRSFLQRLGMVSSVRPPPHQHLVAAIEQAISSMFHLNDSVFVAACAALPSDPQMSVKRVLVNAKICRHIEERIAAHLRGEKYGAAAAASAATSAPVPVPRAHASEVDGSMEPYEIEASPAVNSPDPIPNAGFGGRSGKNLSGSGNVAWAETNNAPTYATRTPSPAQQVEKYAPGSAPGTDPVIKYMVRPPLSEEKLSRDWMRDTPEILSMLSMSASAQDQYSGMQQMVQLARQNQPEVWGKYFGQILLSLLEGIGQTSLHPNQMSPTNSGAERFSSDNASAIKHLYLQGVRALLKYQPMYFADYIEIVIDRLLQCSKDPSYEIVHTAERALENLVTALDASRCLKVIMPYLERSSEQEMLLSCVRTLQKFMNRIPSNVLLSNLQYIIPPIVHCFSSPNVDMRKSVVFALVQAYFVLGDKLMPHLTELNAAQLKLITIYVEREQKNKTRASTAPERQSGLRENV